MGGVMQVFPEWLANMHPSFRPNLELPMLTLKSEPIAPACLKEKQPYNANHNGQNASEGAGTMLTGKVYHGNMHLTHACHHQGLGG